jgi:hypothetical protein
MRCPGSSLGAIGFAILVLAINFALIRGALFSRDLEDGAIFAFLLLPMLDTLLIALYRLRRRNRRTKQAIAFLIAGTGATLVVLVSCFIAPEAALGVLRAIDRPIALASVSGLSRLLGNATMQNWAVVLTMAIAFELLFPIAFFCFPPLLIALLGRWLAPRLRPVQQIADVGSVENNPVGRVV